MRDGEVSILGGLSDRENSATISGLPGVTNMPILGYIFGNKNKSMTDNQILIAMIPHIVRSADTTNSGDLGVYAGTERVIRVERSREQPAGGVPASGSMSGSPSSMNPPSPVAVPPPASATPSPLLPSAIRPGVPPLIGTPSTPPPDPIGSAAPNQAGSNGQLPTQPTSPRAVPRTTRPGGPPDPVGSSPPPQ